MKDVKGMHHVTLHHHQVTRSTRAVGDLLSWDAPVRLSQVRVLHNNDGFHQPHPDDESSEHAAHLAWIKVSCEMHAVAGCRRIPLRSAPSCLGCTPFIARFLSQPEVKVLQTFDRVMRIDGEPCPARSSEAVEVDPAPSVHHHRAIIDLRVAHQALDRCAKTRAKAGYRLHYPLGDHAPAEMLGQLRTTGCKRGPPMSQLKTMPVKAADSCELPSVVNCLWRYPQVRAPRPRACQARPAMLPGRTFNCNMTARCTSLKCSWQERRAVQRCLPAH